MNLPERIKQHQAESESYAILIYHLRKLGIFRNLTENDYGIDFEIEIVKDGQVTGKFVKAQVKSSAKINIREKDSVPTVGGIKQSTLNYWTELSRHVNVLIYAVDLTTEAIYMTKPIFWQAAKLIDGSDESKTVEFLPVDKHHIEIASALTYCYALAPTVSDHIHWHTQALRQIDNFLSLYSGVFHYDAECTVQDPEVFESFLDTTSALHLESMKTNYFKAKDDNEKWRSVRHWESKTEHNELYNYVCQHPMKVLMPEFLGRLRKLYDWAVAARYYLFYSYPKYLELIYKNPIPTDISHDALTGVNPEIGFPKRTEMDFHCFLSDLTASYLRKQATDKH
ncbi:MAG: DUF4365 domain-containing protein [Kiritimatiellae bacterium]|nr:DUF4365 domain-containing protein [Kiritimatiellia bacterium]